MSRKEEEITTKIGLTFIIILESKPASGYTWVPSFDKSSISQLSHEFRPDSSLVGSSGNDIFNFQAIRLGATKLKMFYKRSWEEHPIDQREYIINVI